MRNEDKVDIQEEVTSSTEEKSINTVIISVNPSDGTHSLIIAPPPSLSNLEIFKKSLKTLITFGSNNVLQAMQALEANLILTRLGPEVLPAIALIQPCQNLLVTSNMLANATGAMISRKLGEKQLLVKETLAAHDISIDNLPLHKILHMHKEKLDSAKIRAWELGNIHLQGHLLALISNIPIVLAALYGVQPFLEILNQPQFVIDITQTYFKAYAWSILPYALSNNAQQFALGIDERGIVLLASTVGTLTMLGLGIPLSFGFSSLGIPALGLFGVPYTYSVSRLINLGIIESFLWWKYRSNFQLLSRSASQDFSYFKDLWSIGWPISAQYLLQMLSTVALSTMTGHLGSVALAASATAGLFRVFLIGPVYGWAQGAAVEASRAFSKNQFREMAKFGFTIINIGSGISAIVFASFAIFKKAFISFVLDINNPANRPIVELLDTVLPLSIANYAFETVGRISGGLLSGLYLTKFPAVTNIVSLWMIVVPLSYLLGFTLGWGLVGITTASVVGQAFASSVLFGSFITTAKKTIIETYNEIPSNYCSRFWHACVNALGFTPTKPSLAKALEIPEPPEPKSSFHIGAGWGFNPMTFFYGSKTEEKTGGENLDIKPTPELS